MDFQPGVFQQYRSTSKVHLGAYQFDIPVDSIVEFDGNILKYGGMEYNVPAVRGAVNAGWLVPVADTTSGYTPQPAGIKVRPAESAGADRGESMTIEPASEEEQVVGTLDSTKARREDARTAASTAPPTPPPAPETVLGPKTFPPRPTPNLPPVEVVATTEPPVEIDYDTPAAGEVVTTESGQEAVAVGTIGTPLKQRTVIEDASSVAAAVRKIETTPAKPSKTARTNADVQGDPIGQTLPGGATGDVSEMRTGNDLAELLPDAAAAGSTVVAAEAPLVDWMPIKKAKHWRVRVTKAVKDYGSDPQAMEQVFAVETPSVIKHIRSRLARQ
jgi:hypothetical protein